MRLSKIQNIAVTALEDIKARDIVVLDVRQLTSLYDTLVIATAESARQAKSLAGHVRDRLKASGATIIGGMLCGLSRKAATDSGVASLSGLGELQELTLVGTKITDAALTTISGFKKLEALFVWNTAVTPAAIDKYKGDHKDVRLVAGRVNTPSVAPNSTSSPRYMNPV